MGVYQNYADKPNQIKLEGQEITLKFVRNNDGTGTVTWNIPAPSEGCAAGTGAYDGIVITVDGVPANYLSTSPQDGTFYNGDPSTDKTIHVGDKIDTALVVGAFYNDRTTTKLVLTDVKARTPYYVSAYAVDAVGRYHREGVHAYSLPTGILELNKAGDDKAAFQDIVLEPIGGVGVSAPSGLDITKSYTCTLKINGKDYILTIAGVDAQTYGDLVDALNKQLDLLDNPIQLPYPPNANTYYFNQANETLYYFDGSTNTAVDLLISPIDPSTPVDGTYWFNPATNVLKRYLSGAWGSRNLLTNAFDPTQMPCDQLWFDGTHAWQWDGNFWKQLCVYITTRNPSLAPILSCNTYWFDSVNKLLYSWDDKLLMWKEVLAIISPLDPNTLTTGNFWYDETVALVKQRVSGSWNELNFVRYEERNAQGELDFPVALEYWFIPSEMKLYRRDSGNTTWVEQDIALYPTDPLVRASGDLWWSETDFQVWDVVNNAWVAVELFVNGPTDPSLPPVLPDCAVWYNPNDNTLKLIRNNTCDDYPYISLSVDPTKPSLYCFWHDTTAGVFKIWNGTSWDIIHPIISTVDPFVPTLGEYWWDLINNLFKKWNGTSWDVLTVSFTSLVPTVGTKWWDTANEQLYIWDGTSWVLAIGIAAVQFIAATNQFQRDTFHFYTMGVGCNYRIEYIPTAKDLFASIKNGVIYLDPVQGSTGIAAGPLYNQLGIGDDGSPDERRAIHSSIRLALGSPSVTVELTKEQLDECINYALLHVRKYTTIAYKRGFFFLNLKPNQQTYILTNRCVGFNKIVEVLSIHRMGTAFFRTAYAGNDLFGVAALQQLYTIGAFDMLSYHMVSSYIKELEKLFASNIAFTWNERNRELRIFQNALANEKVLIDCTTERTEQDLLTDRELRLWILNWAIAEAKMFLSQPRGKYQQLPGPNGSTALNTQDLISQSQGEKEKLLEQLEDMSMQGSLEVGLRSHFILG